MIEGIINIIYLIPLFTIGILFLFILWKKKKERGYLIRPLEKNEEEIESFANPIAITILLFISLLYVTFFSNFSPILPYPLDLITIIWYISFLILFYYLCKKEKARYNGPPYEVKSEPDLSFKFELIRKSTHIVIVLIIFCYLMIGPIFFEFLNAIFNIFPIFGVTKIQASPEYYGQYTVVFFTVIAFLGLSTSEIVRVFFYPAYPLKAVKAIYRKKEIGAALGSHIALTVGSMSSILIFGHKYPDIVMASVSISAIGDAAANIVGKKFGKHEYRPAFSRKRKTIEGLLTATIVSFLISISFLIYRFGFYSFLLAFIAAVIVDVVDWLSLQISDNLINPILTSISLVITAKIILLI
ncbi:MAG: hypothetical protein ACTSVI_04115 [Promethearchaeota archaeon]